MNQASRRIARAAVSTVGICALGVGLAVPVSAAPLPPVPGTNTSALSRAISDPTLATQELRERQRPAGATRQTKTSTSAEITPVEIERTPTSATYRFTLPEGETTREGAVIQHVGAFMGMHISALTFITNPAAGFGADHSSPYDQQLVAIRTADLISETFNISGATVHADLLRPGLVVPAGLTSFDVTVSSTRTLAELVDAVSAITGEPVNELQLEGWEQAFEARLDLMPESSGDTTWRYGDPVVAFDGIGSPSQSYPDGRSELVVDTSGTFLETTNTISRVDGAPFSGDRVVATQSDLLTHGFLGGKDIVQIITSWYPEPLQFGAPTTTVSGASPVRDGFYRPEAGSDTITVTTTRTGPASESEARSAFETWATETCKVSLQDPIPGYRVDDGVEPMTWGGFADSVISGFYGEQTEDGDEYEASADTIVYTGAEFIDSVLLAQAAMFDMVPVILPYLGLSPDDVDPALFDGGFEALLDQLKPVDWDAVCAATAGPGDGEGPGNGDEDEPGDTSEPATVTLDVPDTGEAGKPITLSATVLDENGAPVVGQQVTFTIEEEAPAAGTLRAAALTLDRAGDGPTTLTGTTDANGVATVTYTPGTSGTLRVSATTGGDNPVSSGPAATIPVTAAPGNGGGNNNDDDDTTTGGGGNQSGSGALGALLGSLGSTGS